MIEYIKEGDLIGVYGTLRRGERADLSRGQSHFQARYTGNDRIAGKIYNLGSFPGLKDATDWDGSDDAVTIEVFKALDASLGTVLDYYEGWPSLYGRQKVKTERGQTVWVYTYNGDPRPESLIPSGDWCHRAEGKVAA